jgi:mono/diheme cytochrome c family protein
MRGTQHIERRHGGFVLHAVCLAVAALAMPGLARAASPTPSAAAVKEADEIFKSRCATCHGPAGKGDGPASAALNPKPRDFSDPTWQKSVTDEHIEQIVLNGGPSVGKSPMMPANPDLSSKPDVVRALRDLVRHLNAKP